MKPITPLPQPTLPPCGSSIPITVFGCRRDPVVLGAIKVALWITVLTLTGSVRVAHSSPAPADSNGRRDGAVRVLWKAGGHSTEINELAWSGDNRLLASASDDHTVKLWNSARGTFLRTLVGHSMDVHSVSFAQHDSLVISGSDDGTIRGWNPLTGEGRYCVVEGHPDFECRILLRTVAFSKCGRFMAAGMQYLDYHESDNGSYRTYYTVIRVRRTDDGELVQSFVRLDADEGRGEVGPAGIHCIAFSPDGELLASGGDDGLSIWSMKAGAEILHRAGHKEMVRSLVFSPDERHLVSANKSEEVKKWSIADGALERVYGYHSGKIIHVAFAPDGRSVASLAAGTDDHSVRTWMAETGKPLHIHRTTRKPVTAGYTKSGAQLVVVTAGSIDILRTGDLGLLRTIPIVGAGRGDVLSPDSSLLALNDSVQDPATLALQARVRILRTRNGKVCCTLLAEGYNERTAAFSPDGTLLALSHRDQSSGTGTVSVWRLSDGRLMHRRSLGPRNIYLNVEALAFSPDGRTIAIGLGGMAVAVTYWRLSDGMLTDPMPMPGGEVGALAYSQSGESLFYAGWFSSQLLLQPTGGGAQRMLEEETFKVRSLAFSKDGRLLVWGRSDGVVVGSMLRAGSGYGSPATESPAP